MILVGSSNKNKLRYNYSIESGDYQMIIQSERVWFGNQFVKAQIEVEDGKIKQILPYGKKKVDIDYKRDRIVPGFIDVHTHGAYGYDTNDADETKFREWIRKVPQEGVTAFLPTTVTQSEEVLTNAVSLVAKVVENGYEGAEVLGIHCEGPYLSVSKKGAQPEEFIVKPNIEQFKRLQTAAKGLIKYMTVACEEDQDYEFTRYLAETGVVVSLGHSSATYDDAIFSYMNGAQTMTHVYNAMSPFGHREPGLIGAALNMNHMYGEVICDTIHSHYASLQTFYLVKGQDKAVMITDSLNAKCAKKGEQYLLGNHKIELYKDGSAHLVDGGNLAGSTLQVHHGLKNLVEVANVPFQSALNSCTINPATLLKIQDRKGTLQAGKDADIVVLNDQYDVIQTYCKGKEML